MLTNINPITGHINAKANNVASKFGSTFVMLLMVLALTFVATQSYAHDGHSHTNNHADTELKLTIALKQQSGEYHAPYVAAWIENNKRKSVRTLLLWRKEPKWLKDIRKWWRSVGRKDPALVDAITSATRSAGQYPLNFKAIDDKGNALPDGDYTLYVEVVREKGGRAIIKQKFSLDDSMQGYTLKATPETDDIAFTVRPH